MEIIYHDFYFFSPKTPETPLGIKTLFKNPIPCRTMTLFVLNPLRSFFSSFYQWLKEQNKQSEMFNQVLKALDNNLLVPDGIRGRQWQFAESLPFNLQSTKDLLKNPEYPQRIFIQTELVRIVWR